MPALRDGLSERQERAIALIVAGLSVRAVAEAVGVERRTVDRWRDEPAFAAALDAEFKSLREDAKSHLRVLVVEAVATIGEVMRDTGAQPNARLRAAEMVLEKIRLEDVVPEQQPTQADVDTLLRFMRWEQEQAKQTAAPQPQSERHDGSDPDGTRD